MKKVLIVLCVVIVVAVAALGFAVYRANDLIAKFKPQLEAALGDAVGAQVSLGELDVSVIPSTEVKAAKVVVKQRGESGEGLVLQNLILSIQLSRLFFGELVVSKLELNSPAITIIKSAEGTFIEGLPRKPHDGQSSRTSAPSKPDEGGKKSGGAISIGANDIAVTNATITFKDLVKKVDYKVTGVEVHAALTVDGPTVSLPKWSIDALLPAEIPVEVRGTSLSFNQTDSSLELGEISTRLASGTISLRGKLQTAAKTGSIKVDIQDIAAEKLFPAAKPFVPDIDSLAPLAPLVKQVSGTYTMEKEAFSLDSARLVFAGGEVTAKGVVTIPASTINATVSAPDFDLSKVGPMLKGFVPVADQYGLEGKASPQLEVTFSPIDFTIKGPIALSGIKAAVPGERPLNFSEGSGVLNAVITKSESTIEAKDLKIAFNGSPLSVSTLVRHRAAGIEIPALSVKGFGGTIGMTLSLALQGAKDFTTTLDLKGLDVSKLLALVDAGKAAVFEGTLNFFKGKLSGSLAPGGPQTWDGSGNFELANGLLKGVNIPGVVLQKVDSLPVIAGTLTARIPERFRPIVSSKDTPIKRLAGRFDLLKGLATVHDFVLDSDHFSVQGNGTYNLIGPVTKLDTTIFFSKEFTDALIVSAKEVRNIVDSQGKLAVPLVIEGTLPNISVLPNTAKLLELGAKGVLKNQAGDALEKTLDKKLGAGAGKDVRKTLENLLNF